MDLSDALTGWLLDLKQRRRTDRTLKWYAETVGVYLAWLKDRGVSTTDDLKADQLRTYTLLVLGHLSAETSARRVGAVKTFAHWLEEQDLLANDPYRRVKAPKRDGKERRVLTPEDARRILASYNRRKADQFTDYVVITLCLDTGLRRGEVCGARRGELNLEERWLQVWGKGRKQRRVPLSPEVCSLLWRYINTTRKPRAAKGRSDALFLSSWGTPLEPKRLSYRFRRQVQALGIHYRVRFHDLRHAAATYALKAGMPKERVSRMLGHANDAITSIYEHLSFEDVQESHAGSNPLRLLA